VSIHRLARALACLALPVLAAAQTPDILVAMSGSGRVERYDCKTGRWRGTFIYGIPNPAGLAWGSDGQLYVSTGALNGPGKVLCYDGDAGAFVRELVAYPPGADGFLLRANGLAFHNGDLFVVGCDNGKIIRYDAATGAWKRDFASVSTTSVTQIAFDERYLYAADFKSNSILRFDAETGEPAGALTTLPGFAPWGVAIDGEGRVFWSGSDNTIRLFDGQTNEVWAGGEGVLDTPLWLAIGPDGALYCSSWHGNTVDAWSLTTRKHMLHIEGPEVRGPVGLLFAYGPMPKRRLIALGDTRPPRKGGRAMVRMEAVSDQALVTHLGWDTEGGDRAKHNLLRAPLALRVKQGDTWRSVAEFPVRGQPVGRKGMAYEFPLTSATSLLWDLQTEGGNLTLRFAQSGGEEGGVEGLELTFPFDPRLCATTVLSGDWGEGGSFRLPAVISAPDLGQMLVTCPRRPNLGCRLLGNRAEQWVDVTFELPAPDAEGLTLEFAPVRLPMPEGFHDTARWAAGRRGWLNFLQVNAQPQGAGVWANNVISNPVSSTVFWLGDQVLLIPEAAPGVPLSPLLRRTLEFWMYDAIQPDGLIDYVETGPGSPMMDANPSVLVGAWCYVEASRDTTWLQAQIERLEFVARYLEGRDVDGDGLLESPQSGNRGTHTFGDTAWDTYSSGHKNAYVNALAYRAFRCLADLEKQLDRTEQQARYAERADRIKAIYRETFYNPETGWLGWWRSEDGFLHEVYSDVVTDVAIIYGLIEPADGRRMLDAYWAELERSGFARFDLGVPLNVRPVPRDDQLGEWGGKKEDGSDTFGKYLNGGCCVSNAYFFLLANTMAGDRERADKVLDAMLKRQAEGVFPNGGGFQNGVVNRYPDGAEFFDWQGNTCGYEGHLVYSWMFLQAMLLREPALRARLFRPLLTHE